MFQHGFTLQKLLSEIMLKTDITANTAPKLHSTEDFTWFITKHAMAAHINSGGSALKLYYQSPFTEFGLHPEYIICVYSEKKIFKIIPNMPVICINFTLSIHCP